MDAIFSIVAARYAKRAGLKVAASKGAGHRERRARRKHTSGVAPYPAPSLNGLASKHCGSLRRDSFTPPPSSDASSSASSSSPRTPPLGYIEEPLIASRQSSVDCDPRLTRLREQDVRAAKGKGPLFNLPDDQPVPLRTELDVIPCTRICLYDGADTTNYGQMALFAEDATYPLHYMYPTSGASDEQVEELFGMFLNEGYYGDADDRKS